MLFPFLSFTLSLPIYQDPSYPIPSRVEDLLSNMTLPEKIGQIMQIPGQLFTAPSEYLRVQAGSVLSLFGNDTLSVSQLVPKTRLQIPLLFGLDAIHGNCFWPGATVFPSQLGQASTWDAALIESIGIATGEELAHTGVHWAFSPVLCIARDPRWGRVDESYGEDPLLIGRFAARLIAGLQSRNISACAKHFAGYSETLGGRDASEADLSVRKLRSFFLPPFQKAVDAGTLTVMASYQSTDGVPSTISKFLLQETLRDEWGFRGLVVTDWNSVGDLIDKFEIFADYEHAAAAAIEAGIDMVMSCPQFYDAALAAVEKGLLSEATVNRAVARILKLKYELGLFEDPRHAESAKVRVGTPEHRALALRAARESLILLKNNGYLPVSQRSVRTIAVIGPLADDAQSQLGDWVLGSLQAFPLDNLLATHPRENTTTVLAGIRAAFPAATVLFEKGAVIGPIGGANVTAAVAAARIADLIVVVVGDDALYAGELRSTATLQLMGGQIELLSAIADLGKPFVIDLLANKPIIMPEKIVNAAAAIIAQFSPGNAGGQALAEAIVGKLNPSGRLTVSVPANVGQIPVYYNAIRGQHGGAYADSSYSPRWAFGYGLGYSNFVFADASLDKRVYAQNENISVAVTVTNKGPYDGVDVVQIYVVDRVTSATWAVQELKGFERVELANGESKKIKIIVKASDCSIVNAAGLRVVEPGDFELRVAQASDNILYRLPFTIS